MMLCDSNTQRHRTRQVFPPALGYSPTKVLKNIFCSKKISKKVKEKIAAATFNFIFLN